MAGPFRTPNSHLQHIRVRNSPGCTAAFPCRQHRWWSLDSGPTTLAMRPASTLPTADTISNVTGQGATQPVSMRNAPGAARQTAARKPVAAQSDRESPMRQAPCPAGTRRARWAGVMTEVNTSRAVGRCGSPGAGAVAARPAHRSARRCQWRPKSSASSLTQTSPRRSRRRGWRRWHRSPTGCSRRRGHDHPGTTSFVFPRTRLCSNGCRPPSTRRRTGLRTRSLRCSPRSNTRGTPRPASGGDEADRPAAPHPVDHPA